MGAKIKPYNFRVGEYAIFQEKDHPSRCLVRITHRQEPNHPQANPVNSAFYAIQMLCPAGCYPGDSDWLDPSCQVYYAYEYELTKYDYKSSTL